VVTVHDDTQALLYILPIPTIFIMKKFLQAPHLLRTVVVASPTMYNSKTLHSQYPSSRFLSQSISSLSQRRPLSRSLVPLTIGVVGAMLCTGVMYYRQDKSRPAVILDNSMADITRMSERIQKYGLVEHYITPDGNCQFRALADQIMQDQDRHSEVRSKIIAWLQRNEGYSVDDSNSACLGDFLDRDQYPSWENYCKYMSGNRAWGDHLTLVAATEAFGVNLWVLSNVDVGEVVDNGVDQYITTLSPRVAKPSKTARLAHYHEMHYTSLYPKTSDPSSAPLSSVVTDSKAFAEPA